MQIHTSEVAEEVTPVQSQQPGRIDTEIWMKRMTDLMNQSVNDEAVCRTALATPALLIKVKEKIATSKRHPLYVTD